MARFKVQITDYVSPPPVFEEPVLSDIADLICLQETEESKLQGRTEDADALIVFHTITIQSADYAPQRLLHETEPGRDEGQGGPGDPPHPPWRKTTERGEPGVSEEVNPKTVN
jgi:hypothetical protein